MGSRASSHGHCDRRSLLEAVMVARVWYWCIELLGIDPQILLVTRQRLPSFKSIADCGSARARDRWWPQATQAGSRARPSPTQGHE